MRHREETYRKARAGRPERWSRDIRNCKPASAVTLNPARVDKVDKAA